MKDSEIQNIILKLLGILTEMSNDKGVPKEKQVVDKNIKKAENSTLDESKAEATALSSTERRKLTETFSLFNELFFNYQKSHLEDTKDKTLVQEIAKKQEKSQHLLPKPKEECGIWSIIKTTLPMLLLGLGTLVASVGVMIGGLKGFFGDLGGSIMEVVGKVGFMGALKILSATILKRLALPLLRRLPFIGGIINLGFAVWAFKEGKVFKGIGYLLSGLLNFVPVVGPILSLGADILIAWAESKGMFDEGGALSKENGWNTIKGWAASLGKMIWDKAEYLPVLGTIKWLGKAWDNFKAGQHKEGLMNLGKGLIAIIPGGGPLIMGLEALAGWASDNKEETGDFKPNKNWMDRLKDWIKSKLQNLPDWMKAPLRWFGIIKDDLPEVAKDAAESAGAMAENASTGVVSYVSGVWDKVKGPMGDAAEAIGGFAQTAWQKTKEWSAAAWDKTKEAGSWVYDSMKEMGTKAKDLISTWVPGIIDSIGSVATSAMDVLKSIAKKVGDWILGLFGSDKQITFKDLQAEESKKEQLQEVNQETNRAIVMSATYQKEHSKIMYNIGVAQAQYLKAIALIGQKSLEELKRISGNPSKGSNIIMPPMNNSETPIVPIMDNRDGYLSSPYSLA